MKRPNSFKIVIVFSLCLATILSWIAPLAAQTRRGMSPASSQTVKASANKQPAKRCPGGWSGIVTYTKGMYDELHTDEPLMGRIDKEKNRIKHDSVRSLSYEAKAFVDGTNPTQAVVNTRIAFKDSDKKKSHQKEFNTCHAFNDEHYFITEGRDDTLTEGTIQGSARSFNLSVNEMEGNYNFSLQFPKGTGTYSKEAHVKRSGFCQAKNNLPYDRSEKFEVPIDGESFSLNNKKIDPKNPDVLEGYEIIDRNERNNPNAVKVPIITIKWKFRRCPAPLVVTDIKLYEPVYPSPNSWAEILNNGGTIDGNQVKIVATVANLSSQVKMGNVQFKELKENTILPEGTKSETFQPLQEKEVELIWDTSGYAWKDALDGGQPEIKRQLEVSVPADVMTRDIEVEPKPVVTVAGLWSKKEDYQKFIDLFKAVPNTEWRITPAPVNITKTAVDNAPAIDQKIRAIQKDLNAWHVDLAAHSTGGLAARVYVNGLMPTQFDSRPTVSHLVMIGTPNMGTPCVTGMDGIITRIFKRNADVISELRVSKMKNFNMMVKNRNGTKFTIVAGISYRTTCQSTMPGDGIVPNGSAVWNIPDRVFTDRPFWHEKMLGDVGNFKEAYKRFAIGPKGDHKPDTGATRGPYTGSAFIESNNEFYSKRRNYGASFYQPLAEQPSIFDGSFADDEIEPIFAAGLKLQPNQSSEIEIPVPDGSRMALNLIAPPNVSITLVDDSGVVVGKNLPGTPESGVAFRTIYVEKPFKKGTWKLKLESREEQEAEIVVTVFIDTGSPAVSTD